MRGEGRTLAKWAGWTVLLILWALACERSYPHFQIMFDEPSSAYGWDMGSMCRALDAAQFGRDPYHIPGEVFRVAYPLLHLQLFQPLCGFDSRTLAYGIAYSALVLIAWLLMWPVLPANPWDRATSLIALFVSLKAFDWELKTGNPAILELPFMALTLRLLQADRRGWAGAAFGTMASLKLLPLFGVLGFLALPGPAPARLRPMASAVGTFALIHLANALLFSRWAASYGSQLVGRLPGRGYEGGSFYNQDTIDFVAAAMRRHDLGYPLPEFALLCLGLGLGVVLALACLPRDRAKSLPATAIFSLVVLVLWLLLFRQKNYAFMTFIPLILTAGFALGRPIAYLALLGALLPIALLTSRIIRSDLLGTYDQLWAAWIAVAILLIGALWRTGRESRQADLSP